MLPAVIPATIKSGVEASKPAMPRAAASAADRSKKTLIYQQTRASSGPNTEDTENTE